MFKWQQRLLFLLAQLVLDGLDGCGDCGDCGDCGGCSESAESADSSFDCSEGAESAAQSIDSSSSSSTPPVKTGIGEGKPNLNNLTDTNLENIPPRGPSSF